MQTIHVAFKKLGLTRRKAGSKWRKPGGPNTVLYPRQEAEKWIAERLAKKGPPAAAKQRSPEAGKKSEDGTISQLLDRMRAEMESKQRRRQEIDDEIAELSAAIDAVCKVTGLLDEDLHCS